MNPHDAWHVLFFNPLFWEHTGKLGLELRRVCKAFKAEIPERFAMESAFRNVLIRKVDVYRLFPLSINDVVALRSPLLFVDALRLAILKTGGFDFCIAVVREKGLTLWNTVGIRRNQLRARLVGQLAAGGVTCAIEGELFESAVSGRRFVESAVVWRWETSLIGLHESHAKWEYGRILLCIRDAVGFFYKGINRDVRSVCAGISLARMRHATGSPVCRMHHQHVAGGRFVLGVVDFRSDV